MNTLQTPLSALEVQHLHHPKYRPDIDGLRALAILPVVGFHAFPNLIKGGFIGVDIFFIISGYLISTIIFKSLEQNEFSFTEFYVRRIKRIFPALIAVLLATYCIGWFTLLADDYKQLGKHIASGAGFISNFTLLSESGYFDSAAEKKPLLHLWSLGIEEQFYIVWPLLIWAAWKNKFNLLTIIICVASISFALNLKNIGQDPVATFYSPQTRFWELLIGSLLAWLTLFKPTFFQAAKLNGWLEKIIYHSSYQSKGATLANVQALLGALCILGSIVLITKEQPFPGWRALFPALGAALLISAGSQAWFNRKILASKFLVWFGLISFPLYLWHWPLLAYLRIGNTGEPSAISITAAVALAILLAWVSYRFIEKPIRFGSHSKRKTLALVAVMLACGSLGFVTYKLNGLSSRFPAIIQELTQYTYSYQEDFREGSCFLRPEQDYTEFNNCVTAIDPSKKTILLWGDSHAAHLYRGYQQRFEQSNNLLQRTASSCPPIMDMSFGNRPHCQQINDSVMASIKANKPDLVVLAALWGVYDWPQIETTVNQLRAAGVINIDVIGPVPRWLDDLPKLLFQYFNQDPQHQIPERMLFGFNQDIIPLDSQVADLAKRLGVNYISPYEIMCNSDGCLTKLGNSGDALTAWDVGHLTRTSSQYLVERFPEPHFN